VILRPRAIIQQGKWIPGVEVEIENGVVVAIRPSTDASDATILTPAFVNAHSHLEYRGMLGQLDDEPEFFSWIRALTELKTAQTESEVRDDIRLAAHENRQNGVALIGEHADRTGSAEAMAENGLGGIIFQEVITFRERENPAEKLAAVNARVREQSRGIPVVANPHSLYTVDEETLRHLFTEPGPRSIHVAESVYENQLIERAEGPFADLERKFGFHPQPRGIRAIAYLAEVGGLRAGTQLVHACDVNDAEIETIAQSGATIAHCPRSNARLDTPIAPVREILDAGIAVGLGMDSAASSGPIDMFAEMRSALDQSQLRGRPVSAEEVWRIATEGGAQSLGQPDWSIEVGSATPLIALRIPAATSVEDLIRWGKPESVTWIENPDWLSSPRS